MTDKRDDERYAEETLRLVKLLASLVKKEGLSTRSLEKKMGVGDSTFAKVLQGNVTLQVRHVLMICDAIGLSWQDFFAQAYPPKDDGDPLEEKILEVLIRHKVLRPAPAGGDDPSAPSTDDE